MDRDSQVINAVFDKTFVFKTELDFSDFFVAVAGERIDLAVEVELDSLLRFAGSEKPEGGCSERQQGSEAGRNLSPAFGQAEIRGTCLRLRWIRRGLPGMELL